MRQEAQTKRCCVYDCDTGNAWSSVGVQNCGRVGKKSAVTVNTEGRQNELWSPFSGTEFFTAAHIK
jgi:hypothetical protein